MTAAIVTRTFSISRPHLVENSCLLNLLVASQDYSLREVYREAGYAFGLVISKQPPGTYSDFDTSKSVRLTLNGVNVEWLEKSSLLYY
jgi:hypothetical protein